MVVAMTNTNREALKVLRETLPFTDRHGTSTLVFQATYPDEGKPVVSLQRIDGDPNGVFALSEKLLYESAEIAIQGRRIFCPGATLEAVGYNLFCDTILCTLLEYDLSHAKSGKTSLAQLRKNAIDLDSYGN